MKRLRTAVRAGIATVLGDDAVQTSPEQARGFRPHVSIAYSNTDVDATPYVAALATVNQAPVTVPITAITLIRQDRRSPRTGSTAGPPRRRPTCELTSLIIKAPPAAAHGPASPARRPTLYLRPGPAGGPSCPARPPSAPMIGAPTR